MTMTDKLDLLIRERGLNKAELARLSGIPYMTIVNFYVKGTENAKRSTLIKLARYLDVSLDYLAIDEVEARTPFPGAPAVVPAPANEPEPEPEAAPPEPATRSCPLLKARIRGEELLSEANISGYIDVPEDIACDLAIVYRGNSMQKLPISDGDLVLIRVQHDIKNNAVAAVALNGVITLRRVYKTEQQLVLMADHPSVAPLIVRGGQNVRFIGRAVAYLGAEGDE